MRALGRVGQQRLAAAAIAVTCLAYFWVSMDLDWGSTSRPGPGFFPRVAALFTAAMAIAAAVLAKPLPTATAVRGALPFSIALLLACVLLKPLGFILTGMLFTGVLARLLGARKIWQIGAIAVLTPIVLQAIFASAFQIQLPAGLLHGLL